MDDKKFRKGPHAAKNKTAEDILDGKVSSVDERKTVVLDEDLENVEFDDKVWLYWKRNRNFIILLLGAVFAVIVGTQGWKMYRLNKAAATPVAKLIKSAASNATNNFGMSYDRLYVSMIQASDGIKMKRYLPRAKGSSSSLVKRTSNISVTVKERN